MGDAVTNEMRAAWYERTGAARSVLQVGSLPRPDPGPGEVLVRVRASGVNPSDTKGRGGARGRTQLAFPRIVPHQDGAGDIAAVGEGVDPGRIGERVWVFEAQLGRPSGTAAEYVTVPAWKAVRLPASVSYTTGAALGVPAMTAHRCVFADGPVAGKVVLVPGSAGAVGYYAAQFAKQGGATVIATVGRPEHERTAREAGADLVVNRRSEDIAARVADFLGGEQRSVDRIVEVAFGANLQLDLKLLKPNAVIATYSSDEVPEPVLPFWSFVALDATVRFVLVYVMPRAAHEEAAAYITQGLENGWMRHRLGPELPLDEIAQAHERVERGAGQGKVTVVL